MKIHAEGWVKAYKVLNMSSCGKMGKQSQA